MSVYYYISDVYCEDHAPDNSINEACPEVDSPQHCSVCHRPLECVLTPDGVEYVLNAISEELASPDRWIASPSCSDTWYEGEPHISILADWAGLLRDRILFSLEGQLLAEFDEEYEKRAQYGY